MQGGWSQHVDDMLRKMGRRSCGEFLFPKGHTAGGRTTGGYAKPRTVVDPDGKVVPYPLPPSECVYRRVQAEVLGVS